MDLIWSDNVDPILSAGRSLEDVGVRNWGLTREDALFALERLRKTGVAVLGGDVYKVTRNGVDLSYDNWLCAKSAGESEVDFLVRSIDKAKNYISSYRSERSLFAIVPAPSPVLRSPSSGSSIDWLRCS